MKKLVTVAAAMLAATGLHAQVTVSSPGNTATVGSPAQFVASAKSTSGAPITAMMIYVDNKSAYSAGAASINAPVSMSSGSHYVVVQAWDARGNVYKAAPMTVNVASSSGGSGGSSGGSGLSVPSYAKSFQNVDQMTGWQSCDKCAGVGGNGPSTPYSMRQFVNSPSMDGQSASYWIGGSTPYSSALWWKQLGAQPNASHFVYDLYFYMTTPAATQALEFDVNQSLNGHKFIFGTECNVKGTKQWDIWNNSTKHWDPTGVACSQPAAYTWHHLTWQFQRTSAGQVQFIAVTLDGQTNYINRTSWPLASSAKELNTAFQVDGDNVEHNYTVWLDKVSLFYW